MNTEILFSEKQRFSQWWIWVILIGLSGVMLFGIVQQIIYKVPFGTKPASDAVLLLSALIPLSLVVLFLSLRLETKITSQGIYVRFLPFQKKYKHHSWESLSKSYVRKYSPILEFGGWGFRGSLSGSGNALNVSGNKGLQLVFNNRKKLLIGTRRPEEITATLKKLGQLKE